MKVIVRISSIDVSLGKALNGTLYIFVTVRYRDRAVRFAWFDYKD